MVFRRAVVAIAASALLAACGGGDKPDPTPSSGFTFEVAGQYIAEAALSDGATQRITLTVGKPQTTTVQKAANRPALCPNANAAQDLYVPLHLEVLNSSPANAPEAQIGVTINMALDRSQLGAAYGLGVQDDERKACSVTVPLDGITSKAIVEGYPPTPLEIWSPPGTPTKTGENMQAPLHAVVSGGPNAAPPALSAVFMRLTPLATPAPKVAYKITKIQAVRANGTEPLVPGRVGMVTSGPEKGAFYVPLDPSADPCQHIGKNQPMSCNFEIKSQ